MTDGFILSEKSIIHQSIVVHVYLGIVHVIDCKQTHILHSKVTC